MSRQMHLGVAINAFGSNQASWRHPEVPRGDQTDFATHVTAARKAEEGLFDFLFMADSLAAVWGGETPDTLGRQPPIRALDPWVLMSALSAVTEHIGLVATVNTTYTAPPFTIARMVASLDHVSAGRVGWNLVTGANKEEAVNFGEAPHPPAEIRYERATEYAELLFKLWDSWDDDAFVCDKEEGLFFDPRMMHPANHHGKYFHARGPLTLSRSPQGRPVTVQAGNSDAGRELAAATADVVFSVATSLESAKSFYDDVKGRLEHHGRRPGDMAILPGVQIYVGHTEDEAKQKRAVLEASFDMVNAVHQLNVLFGADLRAYPLDEPIRDLPVDPSRGSRPYTLLEIARRENLTLRQLALRYATLGHWILTGTPMSIADRLQEYFEGGAADGFMIQPPFMPGGLDDIVAHVIPELQRRGLFRTRYEGTTLRDHLGLERPARRALHSELTDGASNFETQLA